MAIVGSGPSGFFAAEHLLRTHPAVRVHMFERLPVPFGLVRFGVAPDHPRIKSVSQVFERVAQSDRFAFFGNVTVGRDVELWRLSAHYAATIVAIGASNGRELGIEGEALQGVIHASDLVGWYNGHPDRQDLALALQAIRHVVIIGQGNVACDVARILSVPPKRLSATDITSHALDHLSGSAVRDIRIVGRRGPTQLKISTAELRELCSIERLKVAIDADQLELNESSRAELEGPHSDSVRNVIQLLRRAAGEHKGPGEFGRVLHLDFLASPRAAHGSGHIQSLELETNRLEGPPFRQRAVATGYTRVVRCDLLVRCTGYRALALPGIPFDDDAGIVPNQAGRVVRDDGRELRGLYVVGWIKRGPVGTIGSNRADSVETADRVLEDIARGAMPLASPDRFIGELHEATNVVDWARWQRIDVHERGRGEPRGKPREKLTSIAELMAIT